MAQTRYCPLCHDPIFKEGAYQRFGDVFCSKSCAFEAYPPGTKDPRKKKKASSPKPENYEVGHSGISSSGIRFRTLKDARKCARMLVDEGRSLVIIRKFTGEIFRNRYGFEIPKYESFEKPVITNDKVSFKRYAKWRK